jgi:hypothetical protein
MLEVRRSNVLKDGITAWEKRMRMESDNEDQWSTNEGYLPVKHADHSVSDNERGNDSGHVDDAPDRDYEGLVGAGGAKEGDMLGSDPPWNWDEMRSNGRGPDPNHHRMSDSADNEVGGDKGYGSDGNGGYGSDDNKSG